jgi:hypothetical protein
MKDKTFDAVKYMRDIRDELSKHYIKEPEQQYKDLFSIRKKYSKYKRSAVPKRFNNSQSTHKL